MLQIKIDGLQAFKARMEEFSERRINAVVATALTRTAVQVRDKIKADMLSALDKPTPYTLRSLKYVSATAQRPVSAVGFGVVGIADQYGNVVRYADVGASETPAGRYLEDQIKGGPRRNKRFELALQHVGVLPRGWFAMPGKRAKFDAYGNQSVGEIRQILSWFDAAERVAGSTQNMGSAGRDKRRKGTRKTSGWEYYVVRPGDRRQFARSGGGSGSKRATPGIYRRTYHALGTQIEPIMIFVSHSQYRIRFEFYDLAAGHSNRILPVEMNRAIDQHIERMKAK